MSSDRGKLGEFLAEVINWKWDQFCRAERDSSYSGYQSTVFSLIRTTSEGKLGAIRLAIERVDGKLATPVKLEYPKMFMLYPNATSVAGLPAGDSRPASDYLLRDPDPAPAAPEADEPAAVLSLRQTLDKMADQPRVLVKLILQRKRDVEAVLADDGAVVKDVPLVKSVIAANLLHLAEQNNFEAITEVFDQIDGKLVETIKVLGEDVYLTQYATIAPSGSALNADGIYMLDAHAIADQWREKFRTK